MKKIILLIFYTITLIQGFSQEHHSEKTKNLGIQINPYFKDFDEKGWTFTLRYSKDIFEKLSFGTELFVNTYNRTAYVKKSYGISLFTRYTFLKRKSNYFIEAHTWASYVNLEHQLSQDHYNSNPSLQKEYNFYEYYKYFIAPGIQIPFFNNKLSLDLMVKFSTQPVIFDSWKVAPTFKCNIHF